MVHVAPDDAGGTAMDTAAGTMATIGVDGVVRGVPYVDTLRAWQGAVNGLIETVALPSMNGGGFVMLVNEEGLMLNMPYNAVASALAGRTIVGPVAVVGSGTNEDDEEVFRGLTDAEAQQLRWNITGTSGDVARFFHIG